MGRLSKATAQSILTICMVPRDANFHTLPAGTVEALLAHADEYGYRKPKNANGSRGRYWCAYLQRVASREG